MRGVWRNFGYLVALLIISTLSQATYSQERSLSDLTQVRVLGDFSFIWNDQVPNLNKLEPVSDEVTKHDNRTLGLSNAHLVLEGELLRRSRFHLGLRPAFSSDLPQKEFDSRVGPILDPTPELALLDSLILEVHFGSSFSTSLGIFDHLWNHSAAKVLPLEFGLNPRLPRKVQATSIRFSLGGTEPPTAQAMETSHDFQAIVFGSDRASKQSPPSGPYGSAPVSSDGKLGLAGAYFYSGPFIKGGFLLGSKESFVLSSTVSQASRSETATKKRLFGEGFLRKKFSTLEWQPELALSAVYTQDSYSGLPDNIAKKEQAVGRLDISLMPNSFQRLDFGYSHGYQVLDQYFSRRGFQMDGGYAYLFDSNLSFAVVTAHEVRLNQGINQSETSFSGHSNGERLWRLAAQVKYVFGAQLN